VRIAAHAPGVILVISRDIDAGMRHAQVGERLEELMRGIIVSALCVAALGACFTEGTVGYGATYSSGYPVATTTVYASTPDLVTVSPGVSVVADYDEPVFYTDGFYWRFYDGYWYRSNNYATGWYYWERPPVAVLRIDRPYAYAHYRPTGYVARNRARYQPAEVITRDHRAPVYRAEPVYRERRDYRAPAPVVRGQATVREAPPAREAPRAQPAPAQPVVRDHRQAPPAARKDERDERTVRDHR
jgi:hypothetical protein